MARNVLKGLKQVTSAEYASISDEQKKGYIWFVRDFDVHGDYVVSEIYLGTRKYASTNDIVEGLLREFLTIGGDDVNT